MLLKRIVQHAIILFFLLISFLAFYLTMLHADFPFLPAFLDPVIEYSYGMMAPYQGFERLNAGLMVEGVDAKGEHHSIDLDPYFPVLQGERTIREYKMIYQNEEHVDEAEEFSKKIAKILFELERKRGHNFQSIQLSWDQWQPSPQGFETLHHEPFIFTRPLAVYP
jgi:hypothetical protein